MWIDDRYVPDRLARYRKKFVQIGKRVYKHGTTKAEKLAGSKLTLAGLVDKFGENATLGTVINKLAPKLVPATDSETRYYFKAQKRLKAWLGAGKRRREERLRKELNRKLEAARKLIAKHGK